MAPVDPNGQRLFQLLQQYPSDPPNGLVQIRALADEGDRRARAQVAYLMAQQGQLMEGVNYARAALADGAAFIASFYAQQLAGQPDTNLRQLAPEFVAEATKRPSSVNVFDGASAAAQQGDPQGMQDLLDAAFIDPGQPWAQELENITLAARQALGEAQSGVSDIASFRQEAKDGGSSAVAEINARLEEVRQIAREAGVLSSETSAAVQSDKYGQRAADVEARANKFMVGSITLGAIIAIASVVLAAISLADSDRLTAGLVKASFAVPFVILNYYLIRLTTEFRQEALRWRHIELQLQSATPFLRALEDERRQDVTALLALRFFPGQALPAAPDGSQSELASDSDALARVLSETRKTLMPSAGPTNP